MFDTGADDFLTVTRSRGNNWSRLETAGSVTTMKRARRRSVPLRDSIAFVIACVVIGIALGAHIIGAW